MPVKWKDISDVPKVLAANVIQVGRVIGTPIAL
jgi:hypothetical protein